ncbi:hypothetical protein BJ165DRAFT_1527009 [Panaeolus papilionaceus]|nr:hypothetical protein BJ165DRAFT_1527009 [Panaeolus papilionaceus]
MPRDGLRSPSQRRAPVRPTIPSFIPKRSRGAIAPTVAIASLDSEDTWRNTSTKPNVSKKAKASTTRAKLQQELEADNREEGPINIQIHIGKPAPNQLSVYSSGIRVRPLSFCSGCRNGGKLWLCASCGPLALKSAINTRESWLVCDTNPIAVINVRLTSVDPFDSPARTVYHHLATYLYGNAAYIELNFDFETSLSLQDYHCRLERVVHMLSPGGNLSHIKRFMLFISTHSNPENGDLHCVSDNGGCTPFNESFLRLLKQDELQSENLLPIRSMCVISACGGLLQFCEPVESLSDFSKMSGFAHVLAFSQMEFQAAFSTSFFTTFAINYFVHQKPHPEQSLLNCSDFGAHSGFVCFTSSGEATQYFWSHKSLRPLGRAVVMQCPQCKHLKVWRPISRNYPVHGDEKHWRGSTLQDTHVLKCQSKGCDNTIVVEGFDPSKGLKLVGELDSSYGAWIYRHFETPLLASIQ